MTNEEIDKKASSALAKINDQSNIFAVHEAMHELVVQAYEEAARKVCRYCQLGLPVDAVTGSVANDLVPLGETVYLHRADAAYLHGDMRCDSHRIYTLRDSLVQEPVTST